MAADGPAAAPGKRSLPLKDRSRMTALQHHSPRQNHLLNALPASDYASCYAHIGRSTKRDKRFGGCGPS